MHTVFHVSREFRDWEQETHVSSFSVVVNIAQPDLQVTWAEARDEP